MSTQYVQAKDGRGRPIAQLYVRSDKAAGPPWFTRLKIDGRWTSRKLKAMTQRAAVEEIQRLRIHQADALARGLADPLGRHNQLVTCGRLIDDYIKDGCPDRSMRRRIGRKLEAMARSLNQARKFWADKLPPQPANLPQARMVTLKSCDDYHRWRTEGPGRATRGAGHRVTDMELSALSNVFEWAARGGTITHNPIARRFRYQQAEEIRHCPEVMPASDDEFHELARALLADPRSQVLGWQLLFEGLTGCRSGEICQLRMDAARHSHAADPGFIDGTSLHIARSKRGIFPYVLLEATPGHAPLKELIEAHRAWHAATHPGNPFYFPGARAGARTDNLQPVNSTSLTHRLATLCPKLQLPHRTSHGLRAYHVRTLRSLGIDDSEISKRLGHRSGVALVERTYGVQEPGWFGRKVQDFLPDDGAPAWAPWLEGGNVIELNFKSA